MFTFTFFSAFLIFVIHLYIENCLDLYFLFCLLVFYEFFNVRRVLCDLDISFVIMSITRGFSIHCSVRGFGRGHSPSQASAGTWVPTLSILGLFHYLYFYRAEDLSAHIWLFTTFLFHCPFRSRFNSHLGIHLGLRDLWF